MLSHIPTDRNLKKALIQYAYRLTSRNLLLQLLSHADQSLGTTDINLLLLGFERASKDVQLKDSKQSLPQNLGVSLDGYAEADVERITQIIRTTLPKEVRKFVEVFPDNADLFFIPNLSDMLAARGEDQLALADFPSESGWGKDGASARLIMAIRSLTAWCRIGSRNLERVTGSSVQKHTPSKS